MFKVGDYVAHYKEGVCKVTNIGKLDLSCSDKEKDYYTLKPIYDTGSVLYTPVDSAKKQVREIITTEEAEELIKGMPGIDVIRVSDEKRRETSYKEALLKNECREWVSIIKTSYQRKMKRLASGKKVINVDDRYLGMAERFLYGELAIVWDVPRSEVKAYITKELDEETK